MIIRNTLMPIFSQIRACGFRQKTLYESVRKKWIYFVLPPVIHHVIFLYLHY